MAPETTAAVTSFSKALTLGEIHEGIVFPYPLPDDEEGDRVRTLITRFREYAAQHLDRFAIDREAWIPEDVFRDLGDMGLMGLYVAEEYGGAGLSQTGYARVFEAFVDGGGSLGVAWGSTSQSG